MNDHPTSRPDSKDDSFDQEFRAWAARPATTPPHEAAKRLAERMDGESPSQIWWGPSRLATAAALVLALVGGWWILGSGPKEPNIAEEMLPPVLHAEIVLDDDVALIWLNAETPLYLTLTPPSAAKEPTS